MLFKPTIYNKIDEYRYEMPELTARELFKEAYKVLNGRNDCVRISVPPEQCKPAYFPGTSIIYSDISFFSFHGNYAISCGVSKSSSPELCDIAAVGMAKKRSVSESQKYFAERMSEDRLGNSILLADNTGRTFTRSHGPWQAKMGILLVEEKWKDVIARPTVYDDQSTVTESAVTNLLVRKQTYKPEAAERLADIIEKLLGNKVLV